MLVVPVLGIRYFLLIALKLKPFIISQSAKNNSLRIIGITNTFNTIKSTSTF